MLTYKSRIDIFNECVCIKSQLYIRNQHRNDKFTYMYNYVKQKNLKKQKNMLTNVKIIDILVTQLGNA